MLITLSFRLIIYNQYFCVCLLLFLSKFDM
nr:MAG TPA: hypothetical protein [Caudoviricetes sp.]